MRIRLFMVVVALLAPFSYASGQNFKYITAEELKQMADAKKHMVIVDARTELEYGQGHIPKAVNIAPDKINIIGALLPKNKKAPVVFYCRGIG